MNIFNQKKNDDYVYIYFSSRQIYFGSVRLYWILKQQMDDPFYLTKYYHKLLQLVMVPMQKK